MTAETFYAGIDFGTFKTSIAGSNGQRETLPTAVGWPKDHVARAIIGQEYVLGDDIAENELSVDIVRPFANGALKFVSAADAGITAEANERCRDAARIVLENALARVNPPEGAVVRAVIGAPSRASIESKQVLIEAAKGLFDGVAIVAEPFTVAYCMKRIRRSLVVDIGAGTIDICPMQGTYPRDEDQVTLHLGGDAVDQDLLARLQTSIPQAQITLELAREIKERHGFVHDVNESAVVTLPVDAVPTQFDVTDQLKKACQTIVAPIVEGIRKVIAGVDPRHQQSLLQNVILGGGGSQLKGLDEMVEQGLEPLGGGQVETVYDSVFAGAVGALRLAMGMPDSGWESINKASDAKRAA